jgi:Cytosine deaminase and related metal-dependent hydrolases
MTNVTRQGFLGLAAAALAAGSAKAQPKAAPTPRRGLRTLIRGVDVLTMDDKFTELLGVDVLLDGGKIAAIGKNLSVADAEVIDARGMILMPGMVDGHRHTWQSIHPGHVVKTEPGYSGHYQASKMKYMVAFTPEDMHFANYVGGLTAISTGVTSIIDYAHVQHTPALADAAAAGLKESGVAGWYCWQISHTPSYGPGARIPLRQAEADREALPEAWRYEHAAKMRDKYFSDSSGLLKFGLALSAAPKNNFAQIKDEITRCRQLGAGKIVHHYRTPINPPPGAYRGIPDLHDHGLMGPEMHFDHANNLTDEDLRIMRDHGASMCSTVMGEFPYDQPPAHWRARAAGVAASIGVDVPLALNNDYFENTRAAFWNMYRTPEGAKMAGTYHSYDVLDYATRLGNRALRQESYAGSVVQGMRADLVLLRTDRFGFAPFGSLASRVLNFASWGDIDSVWIAGVARKRNGEMVGVDMAKIKQKQIEIQEKASKIADTIVFT